MKIEKLKNGTTLAVKNRNDAYSVSVQFYLKTGALWENDINRGVAHFLEHMVFNGTENYKIGEIEKIIENAGGELNAATSYDYTVYYITIPHEHLKLAIKLLKELVFHPLLLSEAIEKEKPIVLEEIARSQNEPKSLLWLNLFKKVFPDSNYKYPILGYPQTVKKFTEKTVKEFHNNFYQGSNLTVSVCGKLDENKTLKILREELSEIPEGKRNSIKKPEQIEITPEKTEERHPAVANIHTIMAWRLPGITEDKTIKTLSILESLLSYGKSSLFYQEIIENGIAYAVSAGVEEFSQGSLFYIYGITNIDKTEIFKSSIKEILHKKPLNEKLFDFAKKKIIKSEIFKQESIDLDADTIGYTLTVYENIKEYTGFLENIRKETFENFKKRTAFLKEEPVIVELLPEKKEEK